MMMLMFAMVIFLSSMTALALHESRAAHRARDVLFEGFRPCTLPG
jgi:hypothetical protein